MTHWIDAYGIDGLRLDAADVLAKDFLRALAAHCRAMRPGFWLMGEVIHSENREWANPETLHSATYYELFKGLWSSRNDCNYFELAHTLQRQVGEGGVYRGCTATTSPTTTTSNASRPASPTRRTSIPCTPCSSRFPAARLPTTAARPACPAARRPTATPASAPPSILPASASKGPRPC
ncbi:MAG TPA: hypothetical protein VNT60_08500 [Deinococcales bacterium]|nr:hypothetical protein [Deinococcales bacterium]